MIGIGSSLLFDRRSGKGGSPIPPFNDAMVDVWFMSGLSNNDKPSSIRGVKGNEMALKNFAYALSSGFGKYNTDFNSWKQYKDVADFTVTDSKIHVTNISILGRGFVNIAAESSSSFEAKIEGINDIPLWYQYYNSNAEPVRVEIKEDGIYTFPKTVSKYFDIFAQKTGSCNITITQLPSAYEGALVFDGVDDYGICTGLPILDDYTLICRRNILNKLPGYIAYKAISDKGSFHFESTISSNNTVATFSFGQQNRVKLEENEVSWMTRTSYNGIPINFGDASDTDQLHLCKFYNSYAKAAIYYFALYNKSLTPEEIETEKERLNEEWLKRKTE